MPLKSGDQEPAVSEVIAQLDEQVARRLLVSAAQVHEDVLRAVRLAAADDGDRLVVLKSAVDDGLRTRRFLDYRASSQFANDAAPVVQALAGEVAISPTAELVTLLQRGAGHLVKVIQHADDSSGMIGDLCRSVLDLHRQACENGVADQLKLAKWMVKFAFEDQDFFTIDPVVYQVALGEKGLATYRNEAAKRSEPGEARSGRAALLDDFYGGFPSFAAKYAAERLAIIDRDVDRLIELLGGDLSAPYQFERVAKAMVELGEPDEALRWARRGIEQTSGLQVTKLYDLAVELLGAAGETDQVLELRRHHHQRAASSSTYAKLKAAAETAGVWVPELDAARNTLAERDGAGYIDALLADGDVDQAWAFATTGEQTLGEPQWNRLAQAREASVPIDAMRVYLELSDDLLIKADKRTYRDAIKYLKAASRAALAAGASEEFEAHLVGVRERNGRRPSFIAMLDKAKLG